MILFIRLLVKMLHYKIVLIQTYIFEAIFTLCEFILLDMKLKNVNTYSAIAVYRKSIIFNMSRIISAIQCFRKKIF